MAVRMRGCLFVSLLVYVYCCDGILQFASYYQDHMVLQKSPERAVLWGYGTEGGQVTVFLSGPVKQKTSPVTVTKGIWRVTLDPVDPGGPYTVTAALQNSTATLTDVLFGDIWLCGGQSNMMFSVSHIFNSSEELALAAKYPHVRFFMAALNLSRTERIDLIHVKIPWSVPIADLPNFSAVCWLFGRYMYENLKYPIGLVESSWGGTPVEAWSSSRALQKCGLEMLQESYMYENLKNPIGLVESSWGGMSVEAWSSSRAFQKRSPPVNNSVLWNAMIHPLLNMTLKGAIWYQGEANVNYHQEKYNCSFPAMIDDWRMSFHQGSGGQTALDFPFGFVQLSTHKKNFTHDGVPDIRWHQTADTGFVPNARMQRTFMAVAMDLPDETSPYGTIHPRDKQDVAYRLTLGARAVAYNEKDVAFLGPFPQRALLNQDNISILYDQAISVRPSKDIFEICCLEIPAPCDNQSHWVPAPILQWDQTSIQVGVSMCQSVDEVAGLRYAWKDWPCDFKACPVYSASGILPAPPFTFNRYLGT